jgi:hypothetical protein
MERRKPSPTQGEKPQNETNLWTPWLWTSRLQNFEKINIFCYDGSNKLILSLSLSLSLSFLERKHGRKKPNYIGGWRWFQIVCPQLTVGAGQDTRHLWGSASSSLTAMMPFKEWSWRLNEVSCNLFLSYYTLTKNTVFYFSSSFFQPIVSQKKSWTKEKTQFIESILHWFK